MSYLFKTITMLLAPLWTTCAPPANDTWKQSTSMNVTTGNEPYLLIFINHSTNTISSTKWVVHTTIYLCMGCMLDVSTLPQCHCMTYHLPSLISLKINNSPAGHNYTMDDSWLKWVAQLNLNHPTINSQLFSVKGIMLIWQSTSNWRQLKQPPPPH